MAKIADISSKTIIALSPRDWVRWATGLNEVAECTLDSTEFQALSRATDVLVRVSDSAIGPFLALFEVQTHYKLEMPVRIRAYAGLAQEAYGLPVYPVLINIMPYGKPIPTRFESNLLGLVARQDYRVINLWEVPAETIFDQSLTALLPFAPVMQGGNTELMLLRAQAELANDVQLRESGRLEDALSALTIFATFAFDLAAVQRLLGGNMEALLATPFYQDVLRQGQATGLQQGLQQGISQGLQQGRHEAVERMLALLLSQKFGGLNEATQARLKDLELEQAETLIVNLNNLHSLADLQDWLMREVRQDN